MRIFPRCYYLRLSNVALQLLEFQLSAHAGTIDDQSRCCDALFKHWNLYRCIRLCCYPHFLSIRLLHYCPMPSYLVLILGMVHYAAVQTRIYLPTLVLFSSVLCPRYLGRAPQYATYTAALPAMLFALDCLLLCAMSVVAVQIYLCLHGSAAPAATARHATKT